MAYLNRTDLKKLNFHYLGDNVKLSDKVSIYNAENISLNDNCRIDDFCILSAGKGGIYVGKYVHIAAYTTLIGAENIYLDDFSGLSSRVSIYSSSDDYSGEFMTNPTVPEQYTNVIKKNVTIGKHTIIGAGSIILPGATFHEGCALGALSVANGKEYPAFAIYAGVPAKFIKARSKKLLQLERELQKNA